LCGRANGGALSPPQFIQIDSTDAAHKQVIPQQVSQRNPVGEIEEDATVTLEDGDQIVAIMTTAVVCCIFWLAPLKT
jgi:hypothetical protein